MKTIVSLLILFLLLGATAQAEQRNQYTKPKALNKLIERARDAGISDEALKNLDMREQGGTRINVLRYIEEFESKKRVKEEELKTFLDKRFLTVNDIFKELVDHEEHQLIELREELVSE